MPVLCFITCITSFSKQCTEEHILFLIHIISCFFLYEGVTKRFQTGCQEQELQMVQLCATRCNCITILGVSIVSFAIITLCVAYQRVFIVISIYFVMTQFENFWIHPCVLTHVLLIYYVMLKKTLYPF
jgi:hypothetical protein